MIPKDYSWSIVAWKALRGALLGTLAILLSSGGIDYFFNTLVSGVGAFGLPVWAIPVVTAGIVFLRNFIKQYLAGKVPTPPVEPVQ